MVTKLKDICSKNVDSIFDNLVKEELIHRESDFFIKSKGCVFNECFYYLYPLAEFLDTSPTVDFFLYNSYLHAYAHFLDQSLDSLENSPSTKVRSFQISTYLLLNYLEWVTKEFNSKIKTMFYNYYKENTNYVIDEKKWKFPQCYISKYSSTRNIHKKAYLLLFPLELYSTSKKVFILKKLFINYFSFTLLADDIFDLDFDISHRCLTYPISIYFKLKHALPHDQTELMSIKFQIVKTLKNFLHNIGQLEEDIGQHSVIINERISQIRNGLSKRGIEL